MAITATELAKSLNLTKGRISQYVRAGKLDGCYQGEGRQRRFDLDRVKAALGRNLDQGQMMGNGASTQKALSDIEGEAAPKPTKHPVGARKLEDADADRYQLARTLKAEEEARKMRRQNEQDEGKYVLASEVYLQVSKQIGQEVAEFESVLRDAARSIADEFGIDFKTVRQLLISRWRDHRDHRSKMLAKNTEGAEMSDAEKDADI